MLSKENIDNLIKKADELNITVTLPTHRKGEEVQQNPIRFKNLISETEKKLNTQGVKPERVDSLLKRPRQLMDDLNFWNYTDEALAMYINDDTFEMYKLPYKVDERVYVNNHFLITPVLPMISLDGTYNILAVSQKNLRLLKCTRKTVEEVTPDDIFTNIEDFIEETPESHLQFHTRADNMDAMFFGHGGNEEDKRLVVEKYLRGVEESVTKQLKQVNEPLILAGTDEITTIYRSLNKYNRLLENTVPGYPGNKKEKELQEAGWHIIREHFLKDMYKAIDQFKDQSESKISNNLTQIVESTVMGKTDTLFIAKDEVSWGMYDEEEHTVHYSNSNNGDQNELLNWAALKALEKGSKVFVLPKHEMPHASTIAALFRF